MLILAVCDDDRNELDHITAIIHHWRSTHPSQEILVRTYSSPIALLHAAESGEIFDIFVLDILMPQMTGIQLGERLCSLFTDPLLIFLTSSVDYYPDAFRLYAFQYIIKPLAKAEICSVLDKALVRCEKHRQSMFSLKTNDGLIQIPIHTIVYAELLSHTCHFHLSDQTVFQSKYLRMRFNDFLSPLLEQKNFIKTHTAFVVNLDLVRKLSPGKLTVATGQEVPISRTYIRQVQQTFIDYALGKQDSSRDFRG